MTGRHEVGRLKRRLDAIFDRARQIQDDEVRADLSRFLCILISGWFEKSLRELLLEFVRRTAAAPIQNYMRVSLDRLTNIKKGKLLDTLGSFDARWRDEFDGFLIDQREAALTSIVALRNDIAHGGAAAISFATVREYYSSIEEIVERLADRLDPLD